MSRLRWAVLVSLVILVALLTLIPPFAYLTPWASPGRAVGGKLDQLVGLTGLDPLDPNQPLTGYRLKPYLPASLRADPATVRVEMQYADGSAREYAIPVAQYNQVRDGWGYTGLDRLFAPHQALPYLPLADASAPARLGPPRRLALPVSAHQLGTGDLGGWLTSYPRWGEEMVWSPEGRRFLLKTAPLHEGSGMSALWLVSLDGDVRQIAADAISYTWSTDGGMVVYLRPLAALAPGVPRFAIVALDPAAGRATTLGETGLGRVAVVGNRVWFVQDGRLWNAGLTGEPATPLGVLPGVSEASAMTGALAVSPDGGRVAYLCDESDLCLADTDGSQAVRLDLGYRSPNGGDAKADGPLSPAATAEPKQRSTLPQLATLGLAWSPQGDRLAVVTGSHAAAVGPTEPRFWLVDRAGQTLQSGLLGPDGTTRPPQWTPDGRLVVVNTFPASGRRMVALAADSGQVWDLSQARWDTFASLSPDGRQVLLWNGRGGFWTAPLETLR